MRKISGVLLIGVLLLSGCSASTPEEPVPDETKPQVTAPVVGADPIAFCEKFAEGITDYASFILESATADVDMSAYKIQLSRMEAMDEVVPADAKATLAQYADPVYQIKAVVDAGGGNLTFNTDGYKAANLDLMQYCIDAGYSKG